MPDGIGGSFGRLPTLELIQKTGLATTIAERDRLLASLRQQVEEARVALRSYEERISALEAAFEANQNIEEPLCNLCKEIELWEQVDGDRLSAWIIKLRAKLAEPGNMFTSEVRGLSGESIDFAQAWVAMLRRVLALSERRIQSNGALRARPMKGKIDYAELSREHIARYPKIRARLAE